MVAFNCFFNGGTKEGSFHGVTKSNGVNGLYLSVNGEKINISRPLAGQKLSGHGAWGMERGVVISNQCSEAQMNASVRVILNFKH